MSPAGKMQGNTLPGREVIPHWVCGRSFYRRKVDRSCYQKLKQPSGGSHDRRAAALRIRAALGMLLTTSADHGLIIGAGRGYVKREGGWKGSAGRRRPAGSDLEGDPAVNWKKVEGATCVGIVDPWALIVSILITWPFSWLWPANMRHASAHKRSPAYRRRATGKGESTHWVA